MGFLRSFLPAPEASASGDEGEVLFDATDYSSTTEELARTASPLQLITGEEPAGLPAPHFLTASALVSGSASSSSTSSGDTSADGQPGWLREYGEDLCDDAAASTQDGEEEGPAAFRAVLVAATGTSSEKMTVYHERSHVVNHQNVPVRYVSEKEILRARARVREANEAREAAREAQEIAAAKEEALVRERVQQARAEKEKIDAHNREWLKLNPGCEVFVGFPEPELYADEEERQLASLQATRTAEIPATLARSSAYAGEGKEPADNSVVEVVSSFGKTIKDAMFGPSDEPKQSESPIPYTKRYVGY